MNNFLRTAFVLAVCLFSGCLSRPGLHTQSFVFATPSVSARHPDPPGRRVAIRSLRVAAPFDSRSFVYRTSEYSYESDPYAEFLVPCSESLLYPIRGWMRQCGCFESVVEPGSAVKPNTVLEISVTELYGDFRKPRDAAAVLALKMTLLDASNGIAGKLVFEREYSRLLPLKARTAGALMAGWNGALGQILDQFGADVRSLESTAANENKPN